jgi:hypothetical protein
MGAKAEYQPALIPAGLELLHERFDSAFQELLDLSRFHDIEECLNAAHEYRLSVSRRFSRPGIHPPKSFPNGHKGSPADEGAEADPIKHNA